MEAFLVSTGVVALAEMGDKTQLLALLLAARFRRPIPIILGILFSTLANHFMAGFVGHWVTRFFSEVTLMWILAACFVAMAIWILVPDKLDDDNESALKKYGPFVTTFIAFFLAEMGDKTQVATVMLAAKFSSLFWVVLGTTIGMMIANVPAVLLGNFTADKLPLKLIRMVAALLFLALALYAVYRALVLVA